MAGSTVGVPFAGALAAARTGSGGTREPSAVSPPPGSARSLSRSFGSSSATAG